MQKQETLTITIEKNNNQQIKKIILINKSNENEQTEYIRTDMISAYLTERAKNQAKKEKPKY